MFDQELLIVVYRKDNLVDKYELSTFRTAQFILPCLNIMNILITFVLSLGTFLVADTKGVIQIAGILITML